MLELLGAGLLSIALIAGCNRWLKNRRNDPMEVLIVCSACGRVKGRHSGWDESCAMKAEEVWADSVDYDDSGRVLSAVSTGRHLSWPDRWKQ
jgi:hypothetical protein